MTASHPMEKTKTGPQALWKARDYARPDTHLSDHFTAMAVNAAGAQTLGVARLHLKGQYTETSKAVLEPAVGLYVLANGSLQPIPVSARQCHVGGWVEQGTWNGWQIRQQVWFSGNGTLAVQWQLSGSPGEAPQLVIVGQTGSFAPLRRGQGAGLTLDLQRGCTNLFLQDKPGEIRGTLTLSGDVTAAGATSAACGPEDIAAPRDTAAGESVAGWWARPRFSQGQCRVRITFQANDVPALPEVETEFEQMLARWEKQFGDVSRVELSPSRSTKLAQAVACLSASSVRSPGYGSFAEELAVLCTPTGWSSTAFLWDHLFSSAIWSLIEPQWHASAMRLHTQHALDGRMTPGILLAFPPYDQSDNFLDSYAPISAWSVLKAWTCAGKGPDLGAIYPYLAAHQTSWFAQCDRDGDGIPEWRNTGNPADDSPLYDAYRPKDKITCFAIPPFVSVNLCSYLLMGARCLEQIASKLGKAADAERWRQQAKFMDSVLVERLWDDQDGFFYDLDTQGKITRVQTFFGFLPLWAGCSLPAEKRTRLIREHLLKPQEFWGEVPFPSVAYNHPQYDPNGYWRGRCWPHIYFWLTETLVKEGYAAEAQTAAEAFRRFNDSWPCPAENFASDMGMIEKIGVPNYNWGAAAEVMFLLNWHERPL